MQEYQRTFIDLALSRTALRFGTFKLKSGRESPYFFNAGLFNDGEAIAVLGKCYAAALTRSGLEFDMLFGPAYKGIPLATTTAVALAEHHHRSVPWAFNRKEAKDHGEGGNIVGSALRGRVLIVDDVITAGTAIRESVDIIRAAGATPVGVALALDRQERGQGTQSAVQEVSAQFGLRCVSILTLADLIETFAQGPGDAVRISREQFAALQAYQREWGVGAVSAGRNGWGRIARMRKATPFLATVLAGLAIAVAPHAQSAQPASKPATGSAKQTYKWVDEKGVMHYGDHVPSEYSQREQRVLNSEGLEVQKRQAEMSPKEAAEYAAKQREEAQRKQTRHVPDLHLPVGQGNRERARRAPRPDQRADHRGRCVHRQSHDACRQPEAARAELRALQHAAERSPHARRARRRNGARHE